MLTLSGGPDCVVSWSDDFSVVVELQAAVSGIF